MPNPNSAQTHGKDGDLVGFAIAGYKRGYVIEDEEAADVGSVDPPMHLGVVVIPSAFGEINQDANAPLAAVIPAIAGKRGYLAGFEVNGLGATSAGLALVTIDGLAIGTLRFQVAVVAGVTTAIVPVFRTYPNPLAGAAVNTPIEIAVAAFGSGNNEAFVSIWGFVGL